MKKNVHTHIMYLNSLVLSQKTIPVLLLSLNQHKRHLSPIQISLILEKLF